MLRAKSGASPQAHVPRTHTRMQTVSSMSPMVISIVGERVHESAFGPRTLLVVPADLALPRCARALAFLIPTSLVTP
jgi:hypothetical protein